MLLIVLAKVFHFCLILIETLISLRFVFKLIGASGTNELVRLVYDFSDAFIDPFVGIVSGDWNIGRFYIDVDALIALVVYMILAFVVIEIQELFSSRRASRP